MFSTFPFALIKPHDNIKLVLMITMKNKMVLPGGGIQSGGMWVNKKAEKFCPVLLISLPSHGSQPTAWGLKAQICDQGLVPSLEQPPAFPQHVPLVSLPELTVTPL